MRAAQPKSMLCWRLGLCWRAAVIPLPLPHSLLEPSLGECSSPFLQAGSLLLRAVLIAPYPEMLPLAHLHETPTPRAGEPSPQPRHALQCLVPPWLCSPARVGGRGMAARAGKQKGKCSWGGWGSLGGVLSSCSQLLEGRRAS